MDRSFSLGLKRASNVPERDHQSHRFSRTRIKTKRDIEISSFLGNRVDDDSADSNRVRRASNTARRISKQRAPQTPPLKPSIYCQTGQHDDGNGIRHIPSEPAWRRSLRDGAGGEGIICDNPLPFQDHICSGSAACLVRPSAASKPIIHDRLARIEGINLMLVGQRLGR